MQVHQGYLSILEQHAQTSSDAPENGQAAMDEGYSPYSAVDSQKAWRKRTLAALGAFLRSHYLHVARVAEQIEQQLSEGVSEDIKHVVLTNLNL